MGHYDDLYERDDYRRRKELARLRHGRAVEAMEALTALRNSIRNEELLKRLAAPMRQIKLELNYFMRNDEWALKDDGAGEGT